MKLMRDYVGFALLVAVIIIAFIVHSQSIAVKALQKEQHAASARATVVSLDLQSKCADRAQKNFDEEGLERDQFASYVDNYNAQSGKCYEMITETTAEKNGAISITESVFNAFGQNVVGSYVWVNPGNKKFWEVTPAECEITLPNGQNKVCHSSDEFDDLANVYMK